MTYAEFCKKHDIKVSACVGSLTLLGRSEEWGATATHHMVTLSAGDRVIWSGWYSMGFAHAERWARKNVHRVSAQAGCYSVDVADLLRNPLPFGKRHNPEGRYVTAVRKSAVKWMKPDVANVLMSLAMDSRDSDQPFEDWAPDFGYDTDSRKALEIWNACNDIRRALNSGLGDELMNELTECEEE